MIDLSDVAMRFGPQVLFESVNWRLGQGTRYGLVGANGSGKSTLLKLLAGELRQESGYLSRPKYLRLGLLPQDHTRHDGFSLLEVVIQGKPQLWSALGEKALLTEAAEKAGGEGGPHTEAEGHRLAELESMIADHDGYAAEAQAGELLEGLGLPSVRHKKPMSELSGGYRMRILLAQTLFSQAELLLLDEPTNHLDIQSIRWLESYLRGFPGTLVLVSHDRHFLNAVCERIADVDYRELTLYTGNFDAFVQAKELADKQRAVETERLKKKIAEMRRFITRFKAKATKARQANSRAKQVVRMEKEIPQLKLSSRRYPRFRFETVRASGQEVLTIAGLNKSFDGNVVLRDLNLLLRRGEKLAVIGPNGIGKSTLLKIVAEQLAVDSGTAELGYEVHLGYFGQEHEALLTGSASLSSWLNEAAPSADMPAIRSTLGKVLFSGDDAEKSTKVLSGGESARLKLAALMLRRDNLLVLDEPTNHLDLEGREALLEALQTYTGTLIFVSHDRHFVSALAGRVLALTVEGCDDFPGTYEEYLAHLGADYLSDAEAASPKAPSRLPGGPAAAKSSAPKDYQARKAAKRKTARLSNRVKSLESDIRQLEVTLAKIDDTFAQADFYEKNPWNVVADAEREREARRAELAAKIEAWTEAGAALEAL